MCVLKEYHVKVHDTVAENTDLVVVPASNLLVSGRGRGRLPGRQLGADANANAIQRRTESAIVPWLRWEVEPI